ncbi:MAG: nucleotidyltransferase family protein, partial [Bacteroidales bacterium]
MKKVRPVHKLLIALCRTSFTEEDAVKIKKLAAGIDDWERFVWLANEHGISALVYYNFKELGLTAMVPEKELSVLYNAYMKSLGRNTILSEKYDELEKLLGETGIRPVLIKGMALERTVYGNRGLRQMNDVDFLVPRKRCMEAWEYLLTRGYEPHIIKSARYKEILPWIGKHMPELYKDGISFEMHHSLFEGQETQEGAGHPDPDGMQFGLFEGSGMTQRLQEGAGHGILAPRLHFLFLVKHLHYHEMVQGESQLRLYTDLLMMLKKYGAELLKVELYRMAEELGMGDMLEEKLFLLERFFIDPEGTEADGDS